MAKPKSKRKEFIQVVESLLRFFGDLHVDFSGAYRTKLPNRDVEYVAKYLECQGKILTECALQQSYELLCWAFYAEPVDPETFTLSDFEQRRLAEMDDEKKKRAYIMRLLRCGSEPQLEQDLQDAVDSIVKLLKEIGR